MKKKIEDLRFKDDGIQIIKNLLNKKKIFNIKKLLSNELKAELNLIKKNNLKKKISLKLFNKLDLKNKRFISGMYPIKIRLNSKIINLVTNKKLVNSIKKHTKKDLVKIHMPPMTRHSIPKNYFSEVPAHNDSQYNKHMKDFVTAWIPLVKITKKCQGLRFYYKSKKEKIKEKKFFSNDKSSSVWMKPRIVKNYELIDINSMNIGDVLIFNKNLIHKSLRNTSKIVRYSIDARYISSKSVTKKSYLDLRTKKIIVK